MLDANTLLVTGAAIAAPSLLTKAAAAGILVPAYVTSGQRAAVASLDGAGVGQGDVIYNRYLAYNRELAKAQGTVPRHANQAKLTKQQANELCDALLAATRAGMMVDGNEAYAISHEQELKQEMPFGGLQIDPREIWWDALERADAEDLTDLGNAAAKVKRAKLGIDSGFFSSAEDLASVTFDCGLLAIEMDQVGYLVTGAPETKSIRGGLAAIREKWVALAKDTTADAAKAVLAATWSAMKDSPLLIGAVGFVAWRLFR